MTDWRLIVDRHGSGVWRTAYRLLGNHSDADDCFQKTFLDAFKVSRREPVRDWPALLQRLATARAIDLLRGRYRETSRNEPLADWSEVTSAQPGPQRRAETAELADRLRAALAQLPARQAEAFCLRWLDEMSYHEVGDRLGLEANAVGVLLHRARQRLRQLLTSMQPDSEDVT